MTTAYLHSDDEFTDLRSESSALSSTNLTAIDRRISAKLRVNLEAPKRQAGVRTSILGDIMNVGPLDFLEKPSLSRSSFRPRNSIAPKMRNSVVPKTRVSVLRAAHHGRSSMRPFQRMSVRQVATSPSKTSDSPEQRISILPNAPSFQEQSPPPKQVLPSPASSSINSVPQANCAVPIEMEVLQRQNSDPGGIVSESTHSTGGDVTIDMLQRFNSIRSGKSRISIHLSDIDEDWEAGEVAYAKEMLSDEVSQKFMVNFAVSRDQLYRLTEIYSNAKSDKSVRGLQKADLQVALNIGPHWADCIMQVFGEQDLLTLPKFIWVCILLSPSKTEKLLVLKAEFFGMAIGGKSDLTECLLSDEVNLFLSECCERMKVVFGDTILNNGIQTLKKALLQYSSSTILDVAPTNIIRERLKYLVEAMNRTQTAESPALNINTTNIILFLAAHEDLIRDLRVACMPQFDLTYAVMINADLT